MWHDLAPAALTAARILAEDPPTTSTPGGVVAGVIVALTGFLGAVTALVATVMSRRKNSTPDPAPRPSPLNTSDADLDECDRRVAALELFLWRMRFNPNHIITGEEPAGEVQYE